MVLRVSNVGEQAMLQLICNASGTAGTAEDLYLHLSNGYVTMNDNLTDTSFKANEFSDTGYANVQLKSAGWTFNQADPSNATHIAQTFTFSGDATGEGANIRSYYITKGVGGTLMWSENFASAFQIDNNGDQLVLTPIITLSDTGD